MLNNTSMHRGKKGVAQRPTVHITFPHATTLPQLHHHIATLHFHIDTICHHITCDYKRPSTSRRAGQSRKDTGEGTHALDKNISIEWKIQERTRGESFTGRTATKCCDTSCKDKR